METIIKFPPMKKQLILFSLLTCISMSAQRFDITAGELKNLKGISEYNVTFNYSDLTVHGYATEEEYLQDKMKKRAHVEGKAQQFRDDWFMYREAL